MVAPPRPPAPPPPPTKPPPPPKPRLVVFDGSGWLRSASMTCWPSCRPDLISVRSGPVAPTCTGTVLVLLPDTTVTMWSAPPPAVRMAEVGTARTSATRLRMIVTAAEAPLRRPDGDPVSPITTGYTVVDPLVVGITPIDTTLPSSADDEPSGATVAALPSLTLPMSVTGTVVVTS